MYKFIVLGVLTFGAMSAVWPDEEQPQSVPLPAAFPKDYWVSILWQPTKGMETYEVRSDTGVIGNIS